MASKPSFEKLFGIPPKGSRVDLDLVELWIYYEAMRVEEAVLVDGVVEEANGGLVEANHQLVGEHPKLVHTERRSKVLRKVSMKQQSGHCTASTHACSDKWRLAALCVFSLPFHFRFLIIKSPSYNERKSQQLPIANLFLLYACMMYGGGGGGAQCSVISAIQHVEYPPKNI